MTFSRGVLIFVLTFKNKEMHHFPSQDVSRRPLKCSFISWPSQQARTILVAVSRPPFYELSCFSKANGPDASFLLGFLSCAVFSHSVVSNSLREKAGLKLNIQKTKIMSSGPITSWQIDGKTVETVADFIFCRW